MNVRPLLRVALALSLGLALLAPSFAQAARVRVVAHGPKRRAVLVVRPGHPIRRRMPTVIVRRPAVVVRVAPVRFLPVVVWAPRIVVRPVPEALAWQDAETLFPEEEWAETVFDSDQRGRALYLEVQSGRVQFDFAEVVFENGDTQVVDFSDRTHGPGFYALLDFADGRRVDHVRLIARAKSNESRVALVMAK